MADRQQSRVAFAHVCGGSDTWADPGANAAIRSASAVSGAVARLLRGGTIMRTYKKPAAKKVALGTVLSVVC